MSNISKRKEALAILLAMLLPFTTAGCKENSNNNSARSQMYALAKVFATGIGLSIGAGIGSFAFNYGAKEEEKKKESSMQGKTNYKDFDLSVILSYTCGAAVTSGETILERIANKLTLAHYLEADVEEDINSPAIKNHILSLYPELEGVEYDPLSGMSVEEFVKEQKERFGDSLPICPFGYTFAKDNDEIKSVKVLTKS